MPPLLRLCLACTTLTTFWLALFASTPATRAAVPAPGGPTPMTSAGTAAHEDRALDADATDALLVASREAYVSSRWTDALAPTQALVERFPGQHVYLARLAEIYHKLERTQDEAAAWELFMDRAPLPADACPQIGHAYRNLNKYDKALDAFMRCYQSDRTNAELAFFVGLGNEWMGKFGPAEEFYKRAIEIATTHYDSEVGLARLRLHRNQLAEALALATAVLTKVPTHVDALLVAGLAEQRAGHRPEARTHLEKAARLSAEYFDVQLALGVLDYSESNYAAARMRFETAARLDAKRREEVRPWLERTSGVKAAS